MSTETTEAIRKSVLVDVEPERAFALFTDGIATWWPTKTHSFGGDAVQNVVFEREEGGGVYEVTADGRAEWGRVVALEPPHRFVLEWLIGRCSGTEVEVTFAPEGSGTRVDLEHRGWERIEDAAERDGYASGWDVVLAPFVEAASR